MESRISKRFARLRTLYNPLTRPEEASKEQEEKWKAEFKKATKGRDCMSLVQFMACTSCRTRFYAVKLFDALDKNNDGKICFEEYSCFMHLLAYGDSERLGTFAFNLLDTNCHGLISPQELREALEASVEESESVMTEAQVSELLGILLSLFTEDRSDAISRERFVSVLKSYPDILGNFTIGDGARAASLGSSSTHVHSRPTRWERSKRWFQNNPQRAATYILTFIAILACFLWRFSRYAGSCEGANLDFRDPDLGVTRLEIRDKIEDVLDIHMSDADAKYMAFSKAMQDADPVECRDARKRQLLSWTLPIAKGCGQAMKAVFTLILFPVSRTVMTKLRKTFLKNVFDFDNAIAYHRLLGKIGFALAWIHTVLHVVDLARWQDADLFKQWSFAFPEDRAGDMFDVNSITSETALIRGIPSDLLRDPSEQPSFFDLVGSPAGITGIILILTYSIAALFALDYPKGLSILKQGASEKDLTMSCGRRLAVRLGCFLNNFNNFWYSHHLFALFYTALIFHPLPHVPDERNEWAWSDSWLWIMVPVFIYSLERISRAAQSSDHTSVIGLRLLPGKVVELKVRKPDGLKYESGQYVFVNIWQIAPFEWHPFTLTSAPHEPHLSVHIRAAGDWTSALHSEVAKYKSYSESRTELAITVERAYPFNVCVAGPYGAPAQNYKDYGVFVCIGAGIGVTPFASILKTVLNSPPEEKKVQKVYFHWSVRSRKEASWFKALIDEIAAKDTENILSISIHLTALKEGNDLRVMLLRLAEFENTDLEQGKVVGRSVIHFGRPDWGEILHSIQAAHPTQAKIGVFYCGPAGLKKTLKQECAKRNRDSGPKFLFRKEIF